MNDQANLREMITYHINRYRDVAKDGRYQDVTSWYHCMRYAVMRYAPFHKGGELNLQAEVSRAARDVFQTAFSRAGVVQEAFVQWAERALSEIAYQRKDETLLDGAAPSRERVVGARDLREFEDVLTTIARNGEVTQETQGQHATLKSLFHTDLQSEWESIFTYRPNVAVDVAE